MPRHEREMLNAVLKAVPPRWRAEFRQFVQCGEASEEFMDALDRNEEWLSACDALLTADEDMATVIRAGVEMPCSDEQPETPLVPRQTQGA